MWDLDEEDDNEGKEFPKYCRFTKLLDICPKDEMDCKNCEILLKFIKICEKMLWEK